MSIAGTPGPFERAGAEPSRAMELRDDLQANLAPRERLLWTGFPQQGLRFHAADLFLIPFSLMWGGFALFWEFGVAKSGAPLFFMLWGIPFVAVGLYMIFGRFFADAGIRRNTIYGLTTSRVLILSGLFQRSVKSLELQSIGEMNLSEGQGGKGTVTFGPQSSLGTAMTGWPGNRANQSPAFDGIDNAREVLGKIRDAQKSDRGSSATTG